MTKPGQGPSVRQLRSFGVIMAAAALIIGLWPLVFRGESPRTWLLAISGAFVLGGFLAPKILRAPYRIWMAIGEVLGWINSRIILGTVYYVLFFPMRLLLAIGRRDPMNRGFDSAVKTYRVVRKSRPASHMKHQF